MDGVGTVTHGKGEYSRNVNENRRRPRLSAIAKAAHAIADAADAIANGAPPEDYSCGVAIDLFGLACALLGDPMGRTAGGCMLPFYDGEHLVVRDLDTANRIADVVDSVAGTAITETGEWDTAEDVRGGTVDRYTGHGYVAIE